MSSDNFGRSRRHPLPVATSQLQIRGKGTLPSLLTILLWREGVELIVPEPFKLAAISHQNIVAPLVTWSDSALRCLDGNPKMGEFCHRLIAAKTPQLRPGKRHPRRNLPAHFSVNTSGSCAHHGATERGNELAAEPGRFARAYPPYELDQ